MNVGDAADPTTAVAAGTDFLVPYILFLCAFSMLKCCSTTKENGCSILLAILSVIHEASFTRLSNAIDDVAADDRCVSYTISDRCKTSSSQRCSFRRPVALVARSSLVESTIIQRDGSFSPRLSSLQMLTTGSFCVIVSFTGSTLCLLLFVDAILI